MQLTLHSMSSLRLIRAVRSHALQADLAIRCDMRPPVAGENTSWTAATLRNALSWLGPVAEFSPHRPLRVLCSSREERLRTKGVRSSLCTIDLPPDAFVSLGGGIAIAGPELTFVELAREMDPIVHLLLGMELCGAYARDAADPHDGPITYGIQPVTSVEKLRKFVSQARGLRGVAQARETIERIVENAWSPMEAIIAALLVMPANDLGYDLWPIVLNPRKEVSERLAPFTDKSSRVPDILFKGTNVGLNYDGTDHFGLELIAESVRASERDPGNALLEAEVQEALQEARARIVADKRRDRELEAMGYIVPAVTKEDLLEPGGLDKVVGQVICAIEREGSRDLRLRAGGLSIPQFAELRQLLIWSLMPGSRSRWAHQKLSAVPKSKWPWVGFAKMNIKKGKEVWEFL